MPGKVVDSAKLDSDAERSDEDYVEGIDDNSPNRILGEEEQKQR